MRLGGLGVGREGAMTLLGGGPARFGFSVRWFAFYFARPPNQLFHMFHL